MHRKIHGKSSRGLNCLRLTNMASIYAPAHHARVPMQYGKGLESGLNSLVW